MWHSVGKICYLIIFGHVTKQGSRTVLPLAAWSEPVLLYCFTTGELLFVLLPVDGVWCTKLLYCVVKAQL